MPAACLNFPHRLAPALAIDPKRIQVVVMACLLNI
jgi:hypothetical protein